MATDANFHHVHHRFAGDTPSSFDPQYFISRSQVDRVGDRIDALRRNRHPRAYKRQVPDIVIDDDENSYEAARGSNQKGRMDRNDETGLMALLCRHDIPLFLASINTPGEEQKYSIALIEHIFSFLPVNTTVSVLYDVGCVVDRSLQMVSCLCHQHYKD